MIRTICTLLAALALAACATPNPAFMEGRALIESGDTEQGLARVEEATRAEPTNQEYRAYYYRQRDLAVQRHLTLAEAARASNAFDVAQTEYRKALAIDPGNARATAGLDALEIARRHAAKLAEAEELFRQGDAEGAHAKAREILAENPNHRAALAIVRRIEEQAMKAASAAPKLKSTLRKPITLEFRDAPLRSVFELISKHTGLNFIFDRDVKPDAKTTVFVKNTSIDDVIRFVLVTNQLERKVLNDTTLLIYPNTPVKVRDYRDLVVKSFYLANADVKHTANMIKTLVKTKDVYVDEKLNLLVIRDTPEAVRMAEKLVANQDLAEPEVMLEVEVLEVSHNKLSELGVRFPDRIEFGAPLVDGAPPALATVNRRNLIAFTANPLLILNLKDTSGRTNILANPRIRVKNREKAKIHIGDKVPVITTTAAGTGFVSESVNYLDVGLKLEVEPTVSLQDEVGIKVGLEVSSILDQIQSKSGTLTYRVGTRNAATTLRLKDGETQVLAGLISDEDRRNAAKVPGLGDLPVVGQLFTSNADTANKSEIVLLITPHVVRNLKRPGIRLEEFPSGTEGAVGAAPLALPDTPQTAVQ
jgi:general secretion pathway protein D